MADNKNKTEMPAFPTDGATPIPSHYYDGTSTYFHNTDWGNLKQFSIFEPNHPYLVLVSAPWFMEKAAELWPNSELASVSKAFKFLICNEFKGLDGIEDLTSESYEISDGINMIQFINKVKKQSGSTVTLKCGFEKDASPYTKYAELYLTGINDPDSDFTHYNGVIDAVADLTPSPQYETFTFLYFLSDKTGRGIEKAFLLAASQLTKAELSIYNGTRGEHEGKEMNIELQCIPLRGKGINEKAKKALDSLNLIKIGYARGYQMNPTDSTSLTTNPEYNPFTKTKDEAKK